MASNSSTLAWRIWVTGEPIRLQSMGSLRVGHDWATSLSLFTFMHWGRKWQPTPVFLPGESQGRGAWWAAISGVTQNRTRLKQLSSNSSVLLGFPGGANGRELACQFRRQRRHQFDPWSGNSPGGGHGNPLQDSCLENPMDRRAWQPVLHGVTKSQTRLKWLSSSTALRGNFSATVFLFTLLYNVTFFSQCLYHLKFSSSVFIFNYKFHIFLIYIDLLSQM